MYGREISASSRRDPRRVEVDGGPAVLGLDAAARLDLLEDRLRHGVARAERVGELLAVGVQEHGAVRARRLGNRVALHVRRPGAAVRVVLERVEVARSRRRARARSASPRRSRPGGSSRARRAPRLRGSSGRPRRGRRSRRDLDLVAGLEPARRAPAVLALPSAASGWCGSGVAVRGLEGLAQRLRDRVAGAVADLEEALARRAAAAGEPVAAVLARELDAVLLEPVDRARRLAGQDLDQAPVRRLVRALPDVLGVLLGRVVVGERRLDPALRLRRVAGLQRSLGDQGRRARRLARRTRQRRGRTRRFRSRARRRTGGRSRPRILPG